MGNLKSKEKVGINQINIKNKFEIIKSKYILQKIFNNLSKKISLIMIKYNNNIKKRLDIDTNDYKEYSEKYSSIEIEIKPAKKKYGHFIQFFEKDEKYFHIFFDNEEEETKK